MTIDEAIHITRKRRDWLTYRIEAKSKMDPPWDVTWDTAERDAHARLLEHLESQEAA